MFDSLKITTSYLSFLLFLVHRTVLLNVKNFRESYVFHCLVIKVFYLATAFILYHIFFSLSRTFSSFLKVFSMHFLLLFSATRLVYHISNRLSTSFLSFFKLKTEKEGFEPSRRVNDLDP